MNFIRYTNQTIWINFMQVFVKHTCQYCYRKGFLSFTSRNFFLTIDCFRSIDILIYLSDSSAYIFTFNLMVRCRILLEELYSISRFILYALRYLTLLKVKLARYFQYFFKFIIFSIHKYCCIFI